MKTTPTKLMSPLVILVTLLLGCGSGNTPPPNPTASLPSALDELQIDDLVKVVLSASTSDRKFDIFIARVDLTNKKVRDSVTPSSENILRCWRTDGGILRDCTAMEFLENYSHDYQSVGPWKYSYVIFGLTSIDNQYTRATIRLDEFHCAGDYGALRGFVKRNGQWRQGSFFEPLYVGDRGCRTFTPQP